MQSLLAQSPLFVHRELSHAFNRRAWSPSPAVSSIVTPQPSFTISNNKLELPLSIGPHAFSDGLISTCASCRYPCHAREGTCEAHDHLLRWREDDYLKPDGFDAAGAINPTAGIDIAAVSLGGRANGRWKSANQDAFLLHPMGASHIGNESSFLIGVFDGHGRLGHEVAQRARESFAGSAGSTPLPGPHADEDEHENWLARCFSTAADVVDCADADYSRSGAAAVVCAVQPGRITAAWAGDSRAVLGMHAGFGDASTGGRLLRAVIPLTKDHKPDPVKCPKEAERILASGGRVDRLATDRQGNPVGPFRVFLPDAWTPGLALSRAFGDHIAREIGIVPTPDLYSMPLPSISNLAPTVSNLAHPSNLSTSLSNCKPRCGSGSAVHAIAGGTRFTEGQAGTEASYHTHHENHHVLIVASDGLWEWMDSEEAVSIAWQYPSAQAAAEALTEMAQREWAVRYRGRTCDDITVAVAFLPTS